MDKDKTLLDNPNKYASKVRYYNLLNRLIFVWWYQSYFFVNANNRPYPYGTLLSRKSDILFRFLLSTDVFGTLTSMLDIGSNNWYFLLLARYFGVKDLLGVDIDPAVSKLYRKKFMWDIWLTIVDYMKLEGSFDMTLALSLTHRMLWQLKEDSSYTKEILLHHMFKKLSELTNTVAVIELVTSEDSMVMKWWHYNFSLTVNNYLEIADSFFDTAEYLWSTRTSRHIYAFYK
jgi:hypothetical protein